MKIVIPKDELMYNKNKSFWYLSNDIIRCMRKDKNLIRNLKKAAKRVPLPI